MFICVTKDYICSGKEIRLFISELHSNLQKRIPLDFAFSKTLWANVHVSQAGYHLPSAVFSALGQLHLSTVWWIIQPRVERPCLSSSYQELHSILGEPLAFPVP